MSQTEKATGESAVGILANPASGRDIRRLVAQASVFPLAEKCRMITRMLSALGAVGVGRVFLMPDLDGIAARLRRSIEVNTVTHAPGVPPWPEVTFLDMPMENGPADSVIAVERMVAEGVGAIVVLGGDGTHRLAAMVCDEVPITPLSTGTNNVFSEIREATIAGLATGLVATGRLPAAEVTVRNKALRVAIDGDDRDLALVDVAISTEAWAGSKALWRPETVSQVFVCFAEPDAIGLSSIAGLLHPVARHASHGLRVDLGPPCTAATTVQVPIAPGLITPVGVVGSQQIVFDEPHEVNARQGVIALDGEREIEFARTDRVTVRLSRDGPRTIDISRVMARAAQEGLLIGHSADADCPPQLETGREHPGDTGT
jgi:predicted polyphosphate/ATP-dependent NAD kinase